MRCASLIAFGVFALRAAAQSVAPASTGSSSASFATVVGLVVDSIHGGPLTGATVVVAGTDRQGVVDSTGRFRIDSIPPGDHVITVFHPWLDAIEVSLTTAKIPFAPGAPVGVLLATPSAETWISHRCAEADRQSGRAAIFGRVAGLTSDDPLPDARVHFAAVTYQVGKDVGLKTTTITRDAVVTPSGEFVVCGVPAGVSGTVRATHGHATTGAIPVDLSSQSLFAVTLRVPSDDSLLRYRGAVTGRIVDDKGSGVANARVQILGSSLMTTTTDSGKFSLRDVPSGSEAVDVSKTGFPRIDTTVTVLGPQPTDVTITLPTPQRAAVAEMTLATVGFYRRRQAGGGVFITADTIAQRRAQYIADLQPLLPETRSMTSNRGPILTETGVSRCLLYLLDGVLYRASGVQEINEDARGGGIQLSRQATAISPDILTLRYGRVGEINEDVPAANVLALEYYRANHVPQELLDRFPTKTFIPCAVMAIWTNAVGGSR